MERHKEVVLFTPSKGLDKDACPKCKTHMEPFDGPDVKGVNHRGKLCPRCRYFIGVRSSKASGKRGGRFDPKKFGKFEDDFKGRIRPKNKPRRSF